MRFIEDGPDIPDELLWALDEGRVVFFCGAGVSQATGRLPNFVGLAEDLLNKFYVPNESQVFQLLKDIPDLENSYEMPGLVSIDHIFSYLETEFDKELIQKEVARSLKPSGDLNKPAGCKEKLAHEILLDLARAGDRKTRLVTTNFDLLFENMPQSKVTELDFWVGPDLPKLHTGQELDGIVYLHGKCSDDYERPHESGFVLSKEGFGRAYLSQGWATSFLKDLIDRFVIVFVGYSANDPPIAYLLEGLKNITTLKHRTYAFQEGTSLSSQWKAKGVTPITYINGSGDKHRYLWSTLEAWSNKTNNSEGWVNEVFQRMLRGPASLLPHERGQVAHVVSSAKGIEKLRKLTEVCLQNSQFDSPNVRRNLAEWICVFDKKIRLDSSTPHYESENGKLAIPKEEGFYRYCIDSDSKPNFTDTKRDRKESVDEVRAWDIFNLRKKELEKLLFAPNVQAQCTQSEIIKNLAYLSRINYFFGWVNFFLVADPLVLWWAAKQGIPDRRRNLETIINLRPLTERCSASSVDSKWEQLGFFNEYTKCVRPNKNPRDFYAVSTMKALEDEWDVKALCNSLKLKIKINPSDGPPWQISNAGKCFSIILDTSPDFSFTHAADLLEKYKFENSDIDIGCLRQVVAHLIQNIRDVICWGGVAVASQLAKAEPIGSYVDELSAYAKTNDPRSRITVILAQLLSKYAQFAPSEVFSLIRSLPLKGHAPFHRICVWSLSKMHITPGDKFLVMLSDLVEAGLWDTSIQRDLLYSLKARWNDLNDGERSETEKILMKSIEECGEQYDLRILACLLWLNKDEKRFTETSLIKLEEIKTNIPDWADKKIDKVVEPNCSAEPVHQPKQNPLLDTNAAELIRRGRELRQNPLPGDTPYTDYFGDLCDKKSIHALNGLRMAPSDVEFPSSEWVTFLFHSPSAASNGELFKATCKELLKIPNNSLKEIIDILGHWIRQSCDAFLCSDHKGKQIQFDCLPNLYGLMCRAIRIRAEEYETIKREIEHYFSLSYYYYQRSVGSTIGQIIVAIIDILQISSVNLRCKLYFLRTLEIMLSHDGIIKNIAFSVLFGHVWFLYSEFKEWTDHTLLAEINSPDEVLERIIWSGFSQQIIEFDSLIELDLKGKYTFRGESGLQLFMRFKDYILSKVVNPKYLELTDQGLLAHLIYRIWLLRSSTVTIENKDLRSVLLNTTDLFRANIVDAAERCFDEELKKPDKEFEALSNLKAFLSLYPLALRAHTPQASLNLLYITIHNVDDFHELGPLVVDRVGEIEPDTWGLIFDQNDDKAKRLVSRNPNLVMSILDKCLPQDTFKWPLEMKELIENNILNHPELNASARSKALKRLNQYY